MNPIYPITTDVLYTICNNCGPVQRIVIFRKNGVQAMVEYPFILKSFYSQFIHSYEEAAVKYSADS
uniref:Uncharacterized protein n=1 Tax=Anguilla anguilla TaxID=7936 RepID=A0A0E9WFZ4_ANGAN